MLCKMMGVSRSGYYKWLARPVGDEPAERSRVITLVAETHAAHPSHGYRWVHAYLKVNHGITVSENYIYKVFKYLGIESKTKHKKRRNPRSSREDPYPNLLFSTWECVDRPWQVIITDTTGFWTRYNYWEATFYFDVFTKQIRGKGLSCKKGDRYALFRGLGDVLEALEIQSDDIEDILSRLGREAESDSCILHSDQGSVLASLAYNELVKDANIVRSMSRIGTPGDNPICESLNGWIKEELFIDFGIYDADDVAQVIDDYIDFYNSKRPSYALGYDTPDNYYHRFMAGEIECKDTFKDRVLDDTPKFVRERLSIQSQRKTQENGLSVHSNEK